MNTYVLAFLLLFQTLTGFDQKVDSPQLAFLPDSVQNRNTGQAGAANIIFRSVDGGQTWQDISKVWEKDVFPDEHGHIAPGNAAKAEHKYGGQLLQKISGTALWPKYTNLPTKEVNVVFETEGAVFIGSNKALYKSMDHGKTWERVYDGGWVMKLVEANGVLMATSQNGILRSADGGETWDCVLSEGGVAIAIERIEGGFAAITCNTDSETRRVRTSYDGGKTWQPIDAGLPASLYIASIVEVGEYFFCGHPAGIFRSSDKGKTWKLLLPAIEDKVFNLSVSGKVIYAMPKAGGC